MLRRLLNWLCPRSAQLDRIETALQTLLERMTSLPDIQAKLDKLTADVAALTTAEQSAVALINGLSQQLKDALAAAKAAGATDAQLAELDALDASITTASTALSTAVTANTPTAPAPADAATTAAAPAAPPAS